MSDLESAQANAARAKELEARVAELEKRAEDDATLLDVDLAAEALDPGHALRIAQAERAKSRELRSLLQGTVAGVRAARNLIARIDGDGGHAQEGETLEESAQRAEAVVVQRAERVAELEARVAELDTRALRELRLQPIDGVVAFVRANWLNDGADGEAAHKLCEYAEAVPKLLYRIAKLEAMAVDLEGWNKNQAEQIATLERVLTIEEGSAIDEKESADADEKRIAELEAQRASDLAAYEESRDMLNQQTDELVSKLACPDCHDGGACLPGGCGVDGCERCGKPCPTCNGACELDPAKLLARVNELEAQLAEREGLERRLVSWLLRRSTHQLKYDVDELAHTVSLHDLDGAVMGQGPDYWQALRAALEDAEKGKT